MSDVPYHFTAGSSPILVSMPHVGLAIPEDIADTLTEEAKKLVDTDWYVDRLYNFLDNLGCSSIKAHYSRSVIDLNRGPEGKALYPGQSETELCPTTTFDNQPLYKAGCGPDQGEILRRKQAYWQPYHDKLQAELDRIKVQYGYAILWDAHSIKSHVPRFFEGQLPDLNIGTVDEISCAPSLARTIFEIGTASDYSTVINGRFKGGYITRHYGIPTQNIHSIQMETSQITYMDEVPTFEFREDKAIHLRPILRRMIESLLRMKP